MQGADASDAKSAQLEELEKKTRMIDAGTGNGNRELFGIVRDGNRVSSHAGDASQAGAMRLPCSSRNIDARDDATRRGAIWAIFR